MSGPVGVVNGVDFQRVAGDVRRKIDADGIRKRLGATRSFGSRGLPTGRVFNCTLSKVRRDLDRGGAEPDKLNFLDRDCRRPRRKATASRARNRP